MELDRKGVVRKALIDGLVKQAQYERPANAYPTINTPYVDSMFGIDKTIIHGYFNLDALTAHIDEALTNAGQ